eukprot:8263112-Lingulodinium_polyedra.AAC.1
MHSELHAIAAAPRISHYARFARAPPRGGERAKRAQCEMSNAAATDARTHVRACSYACLLC